MMNGIGGYNSKAPMTHQCEVCGGWFDAAHFCVGKTGHTPPSKDEQIDNLNTALKKVSDYVGRLETKLKDAEVENEALKNRHSALINMTFCDICERMVDNFIKLDNN